MIPNWLPTCTCRSCAKGEADAADDALCPHSSNSTWKASNKNVRLRKESSGEWPGLKEHKAVMLKNVILARQAQGPQATAEQVLEAAGVLTAMSLGLDPMTVRKNAASATNATGTDSSGILPRLLVPEHQGRHAARQQTVWDQLLEPDE